jgi:hypothetical protein
MKAIISTKYHLYIYQIPKAADATYDTVLFQKKTYDTVLFQKKTYDTVIGKL